MHVITGLKLGGAESVLYRLVTRDTANEHIVVSLTGPAHFGDLIADAGVQLVCLGLPGAGPALILRRLGVPALRELMVRQAPDVVQTWMHHADLIGGFAARRAGPIPVCWNIRLTSVNRGGYGRVIRLLARLHARWSTRMPARIVCCARAALEAHREQGYPAALLRVVPNGYDLDRFAPSDEARARFRKRLALDDACCLIGMIARWAPVKNHAGLLDALSALEVPDSTAWCCILAGDEMDDGNAELMGLIARHGLGDRIVLLGPVSDTAELHAALDLHVLCSLDEGFPNVVAEALCCGTPSLVTRVGDAADIVGDTGRVVPPNDTPALARGISSALRDHADAALVQARRVTCRERAERHYGIETMVERYREIWSDVVCDVTRDADS